MTETPSQPAAPLANFQLEIYGRGLAGELPALPIAADALERAAREKLADGPFGYVAGSAGTERTARANLAAFERHGSCRACCATCPSATSPPRCSRRGCPPRCCSRPSACSRSSTRRASSPSPGRRPRTGWRTSSPRPPRTPSSRSPRPRATRRAGSSSTGRRTATWPRASSAAPRRRATRRWWSPSTRGCWAGARATCSSPTCRSSGRGHRELLQRPGLPRRARAQPPEEDPGAAIGHWVCEFANPSVTWDDLAWLREQTGLPIVLKGILHPDDARRRGRRGRRRGRSSPTTAAGRSTGRSARSTRCPASSTRWATRSRAVRQRHPVGADVVKALPSAPRRSARAAVLWGLALAAQAGVEHVLRCLLAELDLTLALSGHTAIDQLGPDALRS